MPDNRTNSQLTNADDGALKRSSNGKLPHLRLAAASKPGIEVIWIVRVDAGVGMAFAMPDEAYPLSRRQRAKHRRHAPIDGSIGFSLTPLRLTCAPWSLAHAA